MHIIVDTYLKESSIIILHIIYGYDTIFSCYYQWTINVNSIAVNSIAVYSIAVAGKI